jgi:carbonic anhydrase
LDIGGIDEPALRGRVTPDAGEAIGLQFEPYGELICLAWAPLLKSTHLGLDTQYLLHMMTNFVRHDVGLREFAIGGPEAGFQLVEEAQVEVDFFVLRTVERPGGILRHAAAGWKRIAKQNELGVSVANAGIAWEDLVPIALHIVEDEGHEVHLCVLPRRRLARRRAHGPGSAAIARKQREEIVAEDETQQTDDQDATDSQAPAAETAATAPAAFVAPIFQVVTESAGRPLHVSSVYALGDAKIGSMSQILEEVLNANQSYAASFSSKGKLGMPPARGFAILTCMDARLDPAKFAGLAEGDAHVIRNAGGRASDDAIRSLVISYKLLGTKEWFVVHHTDCGMLNFTNEIMRDLLSQSLETASVRNGQWKDPGTGGGSVAGEYIEWLAIRDLEQSVVTDVARIRSHPLVPARIPIYGYIYQVTTGRLIEVPDATKAGEAGVQRRGAASS